jgi:crossover junction endodeoxyribonuclease RuvC
MTILGIDPGLANTGYGVIQIKGSKISHVAHDIISTDSHELIGNRLSTIFTGIKAAVELHHPDYAAVESLFFAKNASSAIPVAQARGVTLLALAQAGISTREFSPLQIKQMLTGHGRAEKKQVQELVRFLLSLSAPPKPDHASDALAAAICCYHAVSAEEKINKNTERGR